MSGIIAQNSGRHTGLVKASSGGGGVWNLILTQTASSDSTIDFTSGIDITYDEYVFKYNIHPSADGRLQVNFRDGSTAFDATKTSTFFEASHAEDDGRAEVGYVTDYDLAESTSAQALGYVGNGNDECVAGTLHLYGPSSTTYQKHYIARTNGYHDSAISIDSFVAGYCNVTAAIDGVQFNCNTGNIDAGTISLFGIS